MILDLFAGAGGWSEGARIAGVHSPLDLGIEWDATACETARAAGHPRLCADITTLDPHDFGPITSLLGSPPCQAWSTAGNRLGLEDQPRVHELVDRMAAGDDSTDWTTWVDPRSHLVAQPVRWVRERPETTVTTDPRIAKPGTRDWEAGERQWDDAIPVTVTDAAILQSFPADYPWQGSQTKQFLQVGNAIPPLLAAAVIRALTQAAA